MIRLSRHRLIGATVFAGAIALTSACGSSSSGSSSSGAASPAAAASGSPAVSGSAGSTAAGELRLGYFANVTHAAAVLGVADGAFAKALGTTKLSTQVFNAGPAAIEALNAGAIDAAFLGPSPAINSFVKSHGDSLRIVAGATENGASLVVNSKITSAADLKGKIDRHPATRRHPGRVVARVPVQERAQGADQRRQ